MGNGNRGQKRAEVVDELPADKRACNSLDHRPSTSNSSHHTHIESTKSTVESREADMETSSTASASSRSEGELEKDFAYGSCDSDDMDPRISDLREYQRHRSFGDHSKFKRILATLSEETEASAQLASLTELCEALSFCTEDSLSSTTADSFSPILVKLTSHDSNPNIMLLAARSITYLCDVFPTSSRYLVRHKAIPALCEKLFAIEYVDVAEQCLQALEKISRDQPVACLQAGAIMAALSFIEFFSTSVQRVALSVVVNMCKKLPSDCASSVMDALPILCNLLNYEDQQLVESAATCLTRIADQFSQSSDMMEELCKHGLITQATRLIDSSSRITLSQPVHNGLIGLLSKASSGSTSAFRTLYELNICSILKGILSAYSLSHGISSPPADGHCIQVQEVLKLLHELLPTSINNEDNQQLSEKIAFLAESPDFLRTLGLNILPSLIQVVNSGANLYVCYGCLSVIGKLFWLTPSTVLVEVLDDSNISSFLAGVFMRKDHHVLYITLQIAHTILEKLPDIFVNPFIKEGVFFAIDALLTPEKCSCVMFPVYSGNQLSLDASHKPPKMGVQRCLCYHFDSGRSSASSETETCKLEKDAVSKLAMNIRTNFFSSESCSSQEVLTNILQNLKTLSAALSELTNMSIDESHEEHEKKCFSILQGIMANLCCAEPISTFEFVESGIVHSLVEYLSNGFSMNKKVQIAEKHQKICVIVKKFEVFMRMLLFPSESFCEDVPLVVLTRKLQSALSSLECFPVVFSHASKYRNSFTNIPSGHYISRPCLKVRFVKGEGEACLEEYPDVLSIDPLSSFDTLEEFLYPRVKIKGVEDVKRVASQVEETSHELLKDAISSHVEDIRKIELNMAHNDALELQDNEGNLSHSAPDQGVSGQSNAGGTSYDSDRNGSELNSPEANTSLGTQHPSSSSSDEDTPKLSFYLDGQLLNRTLTMYQAILQQRIKVESEITSSFWSQVYTITYRTAESFCGSSQECLFPARKPLLSDKFGSCGRDFPCFHGLFNCELASEVNPSVLSDIIILLRSVEVMNRLSFECLTHEKIAAFAEGRISNLENLIVTVPRVPQIEFVSSKLTEKLEQQMQDSLAVSAGGMPLWCSQLMGLCPFLCSFESRCKYFRLELLGKPQSQPYLQSHSSPVALRDRRQSMRRKKFLVHRDNVMGSAEKMMDLHSYQKVPIEVEFSGEVGTGLGPTLEFYTLVGYEFQKLGLGMWREDYGLHVASSTQGLDFQRVNSPYGIFPRPWSPTLDISEDSELSEVIKRFTLLGRLVAKALQEGRVLDIPFSKAFYKMLVGQDLGLYDIPSFDPELGRSLLEFQALADKRRFLESVNGENSPVKYELCFRNINIEDLCLEFSLPGYPEYVLSSEPNHKMVNMTNLEDYVDFVVDATIKSGISRQMEAFKSGFNQVFHINHLQIFCEEELGRLLCGEDDSHMRFIELADHIKFDHGYTASSTPVINFLEIVQEFGHEERRAFLQFLTGAPRLPPGGLASLNPKLTIVRKDCSKNADAELPSVMTCANYLKLPPYSSKEKMKEKLLYAIKEGQGSFHLS